jgi:hypothetical protein
MTAGPTDYARAAFERANAVTFGQSRAKASKTNANAKANKRAMQKREKLTIAERETGMTAEALTDVQRQLRADFERRRAAQ